MKLSQLATGTFGPINTEVLDAYVFESLDHVREISEQWMQEYNEE